ncbi:MAG: hypothetical protein COB34_00300 [Methylophilaceae bacterium]|nr:MAG: hypothetical protein COB34_00300 [Methylophilaceae bacterium]
MLANQPTDANITIIGDVGMLTARAKQLKLNIDLLPVANKEAAFSIMHVPIKATVIAGELNANNSQYVLNTLHTAIDGCQNGVFDAMVTAPVHKEVINESGIAFTGHTEFLAEQTNTQQVVMMLVGGGLRVALATTHLPLSQVAGAINKVELEKTIRILHAELIHKFNIKN